MKLMHCIVFACLFYVLVVNGAVLRSTESTNSVDNAMHPDYDLDLNQSGSDSGDPVEFTKDTAFYINEGKKFVNEQVTRSVDDNIPHNIMMFLGDGMSLTTMAATRMYMGDEANSLSFEKFPFTAMAKTYCVDNQVPDSACTATGSFVLFYFILAYLSGVKGNYGTIGVNAKVSRHDCHAGLEKASHTTSIAKWAIDKGKFVGLVTTARVTHASPAGRIVQ